MAAKRARTDGGSVTGGTGDVKPQILTLSTGKSAAIVEYVVNQVALPVPRFGTTQTKATIIEILSVDWYMMLANAGDEDRVDWAFLTTNTTRITGTTATIGTLDEDLESPLTFGMVINNRNFQTSGSQSVISPIHQDFTDNNGNGILVATDRIFVCGASINNTLVGNYICKMKYRLVNVGITEYVGIVQSQQA